MRLIVLILAAGLALAQTTRYPGAVDSDSSLFIVSDNIQTTLNTAMAVPDTTAVVASSTGFVPNMIATICDTSTSTGKCTAWEHMLVTAVAGNVLTVTRGFAGTTARTHSSGRLVSVLIDSAHQKVLKDSVVALETALGPNLINIGGVPPMVNAGNYLFSAYSCNASSVCAPGGASGMNLIAGNNNLTMTPVPNGVNGPDSNHYLYVSGGAGSAEPCLITGGSGTGGQASGALIINCANTHSGAWTIRSANSGISESLSAVAAKGGTVMVPPGLYPFYGFASIPSNGKVSCMGGAILQMANGAWANFKTVPMLGTTASSHDITVEGCEVDGNQTNNAAAAPGVQALLAFNGVSTRISIRNNFIHGYPGNGGVGGAAAGWAGSGTGNTFYGNVCSPSGNIGGCVFTQAQAIITGNYLLTPTGVWGDAGITLNGTGASGSTIANNYVANSYISLEAGVANSVVANNTVQEFVNSGAAGGNNIFLFSIGDGNTIAGNFLSGTFPGSGGPGSGAIAIAGPGPSNTLYIRNNTITQLNGGSRLLLQTTTPPPGYQVQDDGLVMTSAAAGWRVSCTGVPTAAATLYVAVTPPGPCTSTSVGGAAMELPAGITRTARNLQVHTSGVATHNVVVTLRTGGVATGVTCTITAGNTDCSDTTHTAQLGAANPVDIQFVTLAGEVGMNGLLVAWEM